MLHLRDHCILPMLHEDLRGAVLLTTRLNDINNQTQDKVNAEKLTEDIILIGKSCVNLGVKEVIISSILPKNYIALTRVTRQVNNSLRE